MEGNSVAQGPTPLNGTAGFETRFFRIQTHILAALLHREDFANITERYYSRKTATGQGSIRQVLTLSIGRSC